MTAGRSKQVADDVGGTVVFLALPLKFTLAAGAPLPQAMERRSRPSWRGIIEAWDEEPLHRRKLKLVMEKHIFKTSLLTKRWTTTSVQRAYNLRMPLQPAPRPDFFNV